jgi:hypothetical protein
MKARAELDIKKQAIVEAAVARFLADLIVKTHEENPIIQFSQGMDYKCDFTLFRRKRYEAKNDYKSAETGNLFLEVWNSRLRQPSGLRASQSDWYCHVAYGGDGEPLLLIFPPQTMLDHLVENAASYRYVENAGDNNSDGYLMKIETAKALPFVKQFPAFAKFVTGDE